MYLLHLLLTSLCAVQTNAIVGGLEAEDGDYPFVVTHQAYDQVKQKWLTGCVGSIIDRNWILVAGSCLFSGTHRMATNRHRLIAGSTIVTSKGSDAQNAQILEASEIFLHPEYKGYGASQRSAEQFCGK
ncbi:unnamed protein product, partial [Mesorhabditis spiculigera]